MDLLTTRGLLHCAVLLCSLASLWATNSSLSARNLALEDSPSFPALELQALYDLYVATDGPRWLWRDESYGVSWNFTANANPCLDLWQGVYCTTPIGNENYHVLKINLYAYHLVGTLPNTLDWLTELVFLDLYTNNIHGPIPPCLGNMKKLYFLYLGLNRFTGPVPAFLGSLTNLTDFDLERNLLTGTIPDSYQQLVSLQYFYLNNNKLSGTIPEFLGNLAQMSVLYLSDNKFSHTLPESIGNLTALIYFECDTCGVHGTIPESYANLVGLKSFVFGSNDITGTFPDFLNGMTNLFDIELVETLLTGTLPSNLYLPYLELFQVDHSMFHGTIPYEYGNMPYLNYVVLGYNAFSGTIPSTFGNLGYLQYFYADVNNFRGTIPSSFAKLRSLFILELEYNQLTGTLDKVFDPALQTALDTVVLDHNQFTGELPGYLFTAPRLRVFSGVQNCFHGTVPATICKGTKMVVLTLDGLTSGTTCRYQITPGISSSYVTRDGVSGTVPTCLFQLPNLTTLHLSGNRLTGSLPTQLEVSRAMFDLTLSHNALIGSIPVAIQQRKWYNLDLSYNRFSGTVISGLGSQSFNFTYFHKVTALDHKILFFLLNRTIDNVFNISDTVDAIQPSFSLDNNRLSGRLPSTALNIHTISILGTNMFSCELNGDGLPEHDPGRRNYQCGSTAFNFPYYIWLSLCGASFGIVAVVYTWRERIEMYIGVTYIIAHVTKWLDYSMMDLEGRGGLQLFGRLMDFMCRLSLLGTAYALVVLTPLYCALSSAYGIMTYKYAWSVSAAFMSGSTPVALEIVVWLALLIATLAFTVHCVKSFEVSSGVQSSRSKVLSVSLQRISFNANIIIYAIYTVVNLVVVVGVNVAYVYIAIYQSSELLVLAQVLMSFFKLIWNAVCTSRVLRMAVDYVTGLDDAERMFHEADYVSLQVFVALLNNILIPCCVVAVVSPSCFYSVFVTAPSVTSYYIFKSCAIFYADGTCYFYRLQQESTTYDPPYSYSYQCSSSLITYYAPAYVNLCIVSAVLTPAAQFINMQLHRRAHEGTLWFHLLDNSLPRVLQPLTVIQGRSASPFAKRRTIFNINRQYINLMTFAGLLLTFGVVFPPLAVALCVTVLVTAYFSKLKVGRFLCAAEEQKLPQLVDFIDQDCQAVGSVPLLLHNSMWMVVTIACWIYTLFLFDTLGDAVGLQGAYWVLIVMPLMPLVLYLAFHVYEQHIWIVVDVPTALDLRSKCQRRDPVLDIRAAAESVEVEMVPPQVQVTHNPIATLRHEALSNV